MYRKVLTVRIRGLGLKKIYQRSRVNKSRVGLIGVVGYLVNNHRVVQESNPPYQLHHQHSILIGQFLVLFATLPSAK
jgi:hypothetical protein